MDEQNNMESRKPMDFVREIFIQKEKAAPESENRYIKFGTFQGVFTPTLLTILGVIMYLRSPWVVGNAGILGAIGIITLATSITLFTALSMSSIVTNIRIRAGGAFSIISQSLGLEAGGAIGIPLYIAQAFAVAMYIFGFREGWIYIFPNHPTILVDLGTFILIFLIANISTDFAFKTQYVVLAIIFLSLLSVGLGFLNHPVNTDIRLLGHFEGSSENGFQGSNFWIVFAIYFPAVTGIMTGANMSGDLKDPRTSIPKGTLAAIGLSYIIYIGITVVIAYLATPKELLENYNILIDKSYFAPIVLAGLLGATLSSALSSIVVAPRILQALGNNKLLFYNDKFARKDDRGEPKFAFYFTCVIVIISLLMRDLNAIAPLLTMFFLITYAMINVVVLIEQGLGQISFRPTLKIPIIVPLLGAAGCFFVMFIINSTFGLISILLVLTMYVYLTKRKNLESQEGDTRSGMFNSLAEWSAKVVSQLPEANERSWQPNLLIPVQNKNDVVRSYKIIYSLARPKGSVKILGFEPGPERSSLGGQLTELTEYFMEQGISSASAAVQSDSFLSGVLTSMQSLKASFFTPNTLFLSLTDDEDADSDINIVLNKAKQYGFGAYLYLPYRKVGLGLEKTINLWIDLTQVERNLEYRVADINIGLLTAFLLQRNWQAKLNIIALLGIAEHGENEKVWAKIYMEKLMLYSRMPKRSQIHYLDAGRIQLQDNIPRADLNIIPLQSGHIDIQEIRRNGNHLESSLLCTLDSGEENALA